MDISIKYNKMVGIAPREKEYKGFPIARVPESRYIMIKYEEYLDQMPKEVRYNDDHKRNAITRGELLKHITYDFIGYSRKIKKRESESSLVHTRNKDYLNIGK